ncbi:DUF6520 family protein [Empedobacter brevis]|uniref:DUF6520 family protein n=1 Tax=Empedobacter brevis TaxID=247 RepID=UPI0028A5B6F2|nr:DUF6520 family protein [Empedobacter brevis]
MKNLKQIILPAVIVLMGTGVAFATNQAKKENATNKMGYYFDEETVECIPKAECSDVPGQLCTWTDEDNVSHQLNELSETSCVTPLYRISN